jgi:hypothetical protein
MYARRDEGPNIIEMTIKLCYKEIETTKYAISELAKPMIQQKLRNHDEFVNDLIAYAHNEIDAVPDVYEEGEHTKIPMNLGYHTGYKQLCIIMERHGNYAEVIRLATQAKKEGWYGDWDKRIEKAKKKLGAL